MPHVERQNLECYVHRTHEAFVPSFCSCILTFVFLIFTIATKSPRPLPVCWIGLCGKGTCVNVNNKATCL